MKIEKSTRYERLEHPAGEAQVDFGNMTVVKDGAYKDIKALLLSFPYSNAAFVYPLPSENTECFLEGLKQLFHQAGGVPTHLRIDNLSAAVVTVGKGDNRTYTDAFLQFQMHYNFEVQPCNPYSGHEKGNVERKVCYTRNNWFTTAPIMESFSQLAQWLEVQAMEDQKRLHYEKEVMIEDLWNDDKALKPLPLEDLTVFSLDTTTVNKYGEITVDQECFVLRKTNVKQVIIIKKNGINLHVIQQKEKTFLQNTDRICTRIDRFPGKRFLKIGKRNHVLFVILDFSNIYLSGFKIICSFIRMKEKLV